MDKSQPTIQTVTVNLFYNEDNPMQLSVPINVDFVPDLITLKSYYVYYLDFATVNDQVIGIFNVSSDLIPANSNTIVSFPVRSNLVVLDNTAPEYIELGYTQFKKVNYKWTNKAKKNIHGNFSFYLTSLQQSSIPFTATNALSVSFTFEFLKY